jgi:hypothetical protein
MTARDVLLFALACVPAAIGLILIGAYCHDVIGDILSRLRSLPFLLPAFRPHAGHHVHGSSLARDYPYLPVPAAQASVSLAGYLCCVHCADGSPCEPRHSHPEPCFDCPVPYVPADVQVQAHADVMHELSVPYLPQLQHGDNPYPPYVIPWEPATRPDVAFPSMLPSRGLTGPMPALTDAQIAIEAAQEKRAQLTLSLFRAAAEQHGEVTPDDMQAALTALRAVPVPDPYEAPAASAPGYGQVPVAEVLESERLADVMQQ